MKLTKYVLIILIVLIISTLMGCKEKNNDKTSLIENDTNMAETVTKDGPNKVESISISELKDLLMRANRIEVKNVNNETIGLLNTVEKINKAVEDIFGYSIVDNQEYSLEDEVLATINFYFQGEDPIYGLIKNKLIYIEGYYFMNNNDKIHKTIDYFRINTDQEPIVGD